MKICFLDKTSFKYNINDINSYKLRGAETVLINLAKSLNKFGHSVSVINNCPKNEKIKGIDWININSISDKPTFDVAISNNDCKLFDYINSNRNILLSHSIQNLEKFIRKKQFFSYFKYKPKVALLGNYHLSKRSYLTRIYGYFMLPYGLDEIFLKTDLNKNEKIDKNLAIFTSRSDRNLNLLIEIWSNYILSKYNNAKLLITPINSKNFEKFNIFNRTLGERNIMINDLLKARMLLVPGHKSELFCLAAEEARELCLPIVTMGIGSLSERVEHGKTGFIAKTKNEFAEYSIKLFKDDNLWNELRSNLFTLRSSKTWENCAKILIENF